MFIWFVWVHFVHTKYQSKLNKTKISCLIYEVETVLCKIMFKILIFSYLILQGSRDVYRRQENSSIEIL